MEYYPGQTIIFNTAFETAEGVFIDPASPLVYLYDPIDNITSLPLTRQETGEYWLAWAIPADALPGTYKFKYSGTYLVQGVLTEVKSALEYFQVLPSWAAMEAGAQGLYCTVGDIRNRLVWLTLTVMSDNLVVQDHILPAMAEIDAALGGRYTVPFNPVPPLITAITRDLASASAANLTHQGDGTAEEVPLSVRMRGWGRQKLTELRDGTTRLPGVPQNVRVVSSTYHTRHRESPLQRFTLYREPRDMERPARIVWPNGIW